MTHPFDYSVKVLREKGPRSAESAGGGGAWSFTLMRE